jgi:hypothetical protein
MWKLRYIFNAVNSMRLSARINFGGYYSITKTVIRNLAKVHSKQSQVHYSEKAVEQPAARQNLNWPPYDSTHRERLTADGHILTSSNSRHSCFKLLCQPPQLVIGWFQQVGCCCRKSPRGPIMRMNRTNLGRSPDISVKTRTPYMVNVPTSVSRVVTREASNKF